MNKFFSAALVAAALLMAQGCAVSPINPAAPAAAMATEWVAIAEGGEGTLVLTRSQGVGVGVWFCPLLVTASPAQIRAGRGKVPSALFQGASPCRQGEAVTYRGIASGGEVDFLLLCRGAIPWRCHFPKGGLDGMDAVLREGGIPPMNPAVLGGVGCAFDGAPRQDLPPCQ